MSDAYRRVATGARSSELPAYRFLPPLDRWLAGLLPQMQHWEWQEPELDGMTPATIEIHKAWEVADAC